MTISEMVDGLSVLSFRAVMLALWNRSCFRQYLACSLKKYDELVGNGLPPASPATPDANLKITIPAAHPGGGMSFGELVVLARVTVALKPRSIFEIGTYNGLSTAVFVLNAGSDTSIMTLDLPLNCPGSIADLPSDRELVSSRLVGSVPQALGLTRYKQIFCDSMAFDPSPYLGKVDLALIDGAHDSMHVENDTRKVAKMITDRGMVFWHDYGGKGALRELSSYLERLARQRPLFRVPGTSLAWARGIDLKSTVRNDEMLTLS